MKYYLYILRSLKDNNFYVGISADPEKRLGNHNSGKTASTKARKPFILVYTEVHNSREEARQKEIYLKSYAGVREKRQILENL